MNEVSEIIKKRRSVRKNIVTHWIGEAISGIKYHILDIGIANWHSKRLCEIEKSGKFIKTSKLLCNYQKF